MLASMKRLLLLLLFAILPAPALAADYPARVVGISDGDTLTVLTAAKKQVKVRLYGVDAPETGQDFGSRAKQAASDMAFGKDVTIRERDKDRYGRTVAEVILPDGKSLNREMVRTGMAHWYRQFAPRDRELEQLESEARTAKRGLWSQPNPTPPWDWRHPKVADTGQVVGNRNSHIFHAPNCPSIARMKATNRVAFRTAGEAEGAGYRKGKDCR
jgi:micrococcal nuclease